LPQNWFYWFLPKLTYFVTVGEFNSDAG
jgi:hypothetical protein